MKTIFSFVAVCLVAALVGCQTTNPTVAPGTLSECGAKAGQACTKDKNECCGSKDCKRTDMGAVGDCGAACTRPKSDCTGGCSKSGCHHNKAEDASLGAVGEKAGCEKVRCGAKRDCSSKSGCHHNKVDADDASLGAVSDEKARCGAKRGCGARKNRCGAM